MLVGEGAVPLPMVSYNNRISLAIKAKQNYSYAEYMSIQMPMAEMNPAILDNVNSDKNFRDGWRNAGLQEDGLASELEVDETRQARAEAQQQQMQMEQAAQSAAIAKDAAAANGGELPEAMGG